MRITRAHQATHRLGTALADVAVAGDYHDLAGDHHVGRTLDAVGQRFAATVEIVELALGDRVVDVDGRDLQLAPFMHLVEAMNAGGRFLGEAADAFEHLGKLVVDHRSEIAAVVENQVQCFAGGEGECLLDAPIELLFAHTLPGVDGDARLGDRAGGVILGAEDVAAAPGDLGAELNQRLNQHGSLDGHVQAASDASTGQRLRRAVLLSQRNQARHFVFRQEDLFASPLGETVEFLFTTVQHLVRKLCFYLSHVWHPP